MTHLINNVTKYQYRHKLYFKIPFLWWQGPMEADVLRPRSITIAALGLRWHLLAGCVHWL